MVSVIILIFIVGYAAIAFEGPLKLDKTVPALIMAAVMWSLLAVGFHQGWFQVVGPEGSVFNFLSGGDSALSGFESTMLHHFGKTAEILIFLAGAMSIVEIINMHNGFELIKRFVHTTSKTRLLWIIGTLAFILSAVIDNLTTTIVLVSIIRKLVPTHKERIWYASLVVIAANAGGAWSPIGDVTTTMLWIGDKVSTMGLIENIVIPAIFCFVVPFLIASFLPVFKGHIAKDNIEEKDSEELLSSKTMLIVGLCSILTVPITKTLFHLPPYLGMMLALAITWFVAEYIKPVEHMTEEVKERFSISNALSRIDFSSVLFFLGILMAVAAMQSMVYGVMHGDPVGTLRYLAESLHDVFPNQDYVIILLGVFSAIVDNVPLVAATMGMYDPAIFPKDSFIWHFIAYSAGTGGSMLIIGSAAGVAAMGMEKIDFIWYFKKVAWLAAIGFLAGAGAFLFIEHVLGGIHIF